MDESIKDIMWKNVIWQIKFPFGKKLLHHFSMIYNYAIRTIRIHFAICKVESDNSNPEIHIIFTKMILIKPAFNMIWLMVNIKIWIKEHNQIRF